MKARIRQPIIIALKEKYIENGYGILDFTAGITELQLEEFMKELQDVKYFLFMVENDNDLYSFKNKKIDVYLNEQVKINGIMHSFDEGVLILERTN